MTDDEQGKLDDFRSELDKSTFINNPYVRRVEKPWGYELHWVPDNYPYMGKLLRVDEGKRISMQVHDEKQETFFLFEGNMIAVLENSDGEMEEIPMEAGKGYVVKLGQKHRLIGGEGGGSIIEASAPETGNTFRVEDDYNRSTETEDARNHRNQRAS